jgi:integrase
VRIASILEAVGIASAKKSPLFRSGAGRSGTLSDKPLSRVDVFYMVKRRARAAGVSERIGCHTFRATGITVYLKNGGSIETAQRIAGHESIKTTRLYDRRHEQVTLDEVERIVL